MASASNTRGMASVSNTCGIFKKYHGWRGMASASNTHGVVSVTLVAWRLETNTCGVASPSTTGGVAWRLEVTLVGWRL